MFPISLPSLGWKAAAIVLFAALLASSSYLGYQWHSAASSRDTAVTERKKAEGERDTANTKVGALESVLANQNNAIKKAEADSKATAAKYEEAKAHTKVYGQRVDALVAQLLNAKSITCESAVSRQRQIVESLNKVREAK